MRWSERDETRLEKLKTRDVTREIGDERQNLEEREIERERQKREKNIKK